MYDPDALAERAAILAADAIPNAAQQAALQMACTAWVLAPDSDLTATQQTWLHGKVLAGTVLTPEELARITPGLLAWVERHDAGWLQALRQAMGLAERPPVERPRDLAWEAGSVREE